MLLEQSVAWMAAGGAGESVIEEEIGSIGLKLTNKRQVAFLSHQL